MLTNKSEKDYLKSKTIDVISVPDGLHQPVNRDPMNIPYVADDYKPPEDIIVPPPLTIEEVKLAIVESSTDKSSDKETQGEKVALKPLTAEVVTDADFEFSLLVEEKFDVVWVRVEKVLLNLGFIIEDKNNLTQFYTVYRQILKIDFEQEDISKPAELELEKSPDREYYKIKLSEVKSAKTSQQKTRIEVLDRTGDPLGSDLDKHLLLQIKGQFKNPPVKDEANKQE